MDRSIGKVPDLVGLAVTNENLAPVIAMLDYEGVWHG